MSLAPAAEIDESVIAPYFIEGADVHRVVFVNGRFDDRLSAIGRICRPDDVARAVVFLLAGAHCTGSVFELHPEHIPGMLGAGVGAAK